MLSSIPLTVLLSFSLQPFLHTSISFHFHCLPLFSLSAGPSISLHSTLSPSPSAAFMYVCVCVCVAAGRLWLFFRQQPRRLDCHNLWSWVISVSNPNLGTGPFFLSSSSLHHRLLLLSRSLSLPPYPPIISHSSSHSLSLCIAIHCRALTATQANAIDQHTWIRVICHVLNPEFTVREIEDQIGF